MTLEARAGQHARTPTRSSSSGRATGLTRGGPSGPIPAGCSTILFHSKGFANSTGYSNPRVDELLDRAAAIYEPGGGSRSTRRPSGLIVDDVPYVFLNYTTEFAVASQKVQNWGWIPDLIPRFRELRLER